MALLVMPGVFAAPGDVLFSDDFQDGTLAPWTTTNAAFSGVDNLTSTTGEGGAGLSMFTFGTDVTVTSPVITANVGGVRVDAWVRKGADSFSEDPDGAENLEFEYLSVGGTWEIIQIFDATGLADGAITNVSFQLPSNALHAFLQIRFHQLAGSGERGAQPGWDVWHIDDVVLTETSASVTPTVLDIGVCDDFENGIANWTIAGTGTAAINNLAPLLANNSLNIFANTLTATSVVIDTSTSFAGVTYDIQRGSDAFSENPDTGENLSVEYLNNVGTWINLQTYPGNGAQGQFFNDETFLTTPPADARHANFQLRFNFARGNGGTFDNWHVDDVCILGIDAVLSANKTVSVTQDPVNTTINPKAINSAYSTYSIEVTNTTAGIATNNSVIVSDVLPPEVSLFVGDFDGSGSPFDFTDGATSSGITFSYSALNNLFDDVEFLDAGGSVITTVVPDADGFANAVRQIRINTSGTFQPNGAFTISFRVRID